MLNCPGCQSSNAKVDSLPVEPEDRKALPGIKSDNFWYVACRACGFVSGPPAFSKTEAQPSADAMYDLAVSLWDKRAANSKGRRCAFCGQKGGRSQEVCKGCGSENAILDFRPNAQAQP